MRYLVQNYRCFIDEKLKNRSQICMFNASVCKEIHLDSIASIWSLLGNLLNLKDDCKEMKFSHNRSYSSLSSDSRRDQEHFEATQRNLDLLIPASSFLQPNPFHFDISLTLDKDCSFLKTLVREGDLLNAMMMACVLWPELQTDEVACHYVPIWIANLLDLLYREECYDLAVRIRDLYRKANIRVDVLYQPVITFQTATEEDRNPSLGTLWVVE